MNAEGIEPIAPEGIKFSTREEGARILMKVDDFIEGLSRFDRSARLKTSKEVSQKEFLSFIGRNTLDWDDREKEELIIAFRSIEKKLKAVQHLLPYPINLIKTTGKEEGGAAYTRGRSIIFSKGRLQRKGASLSRLFAHELFHVLSRNRPALRRKLYSAIGFQPCNELQFPEDLSDRKITNPDAPHNDHCIQIRSEGKHQWAIPILYSGQEKYDEMKGGEFFDYFQFKLMLVNLDEVTLALNPIRINGDLKLLDLDKVDGFFEKTGRNTRYVWHPDEILADNFANWITGVENLPSPEIIEFLEKILSSKEAIVEKTKTEN